MIVKSLLTALVLLALIIIVLAQRDLMTRRYAAIVGLLGMLWIVLLVATIIALIWVIPL